MGKPIRTPAPQEYRDDPDAISLNTTADDYDYDDAPEISGLPPAYEETEDVAGSSTGATRQMRTMPIRHVPPPTTRTDHDSYSLCNGVPQVCETMTILSSEIDTNPDALEAFIRAEADVAPVQYVYILGTHTETVRNGDKKEKKQVVDFRVVVNMQKYLRRNFDHGDNSSRRLVTAENGEKTHRGTILKCRAPGARQDIEVGGQKKPSLTEWCHRYCASPRMLRVFRLRRVVTGFDKATLKNQLEGAIRSTHYMGHLSITFPVEDQYVDIYTSNKINEWRLKSWICWIFYLTFLWIFTWPYLFFATKRYDVVKSKWAFSTMEETGGRVYTTVSEQQWYERWHIAIRRLALDRYEGLASEEMMDAIIARPADPLIPGRTGNDTVDRAIGAVAQGAQIGRHLPGGGGQGRGFLGTVVSLGQAAMPSRPGWGYDY